MRQPSRSNPFLSGLVIGLGTTVVFILGSLSLRTFAWPGPSSPGPRREAKRLPALALAPRPAPPAVAADDAGESADLERLRTRALQLPVDGYDLARIRDNFQEPRGGRVHEAIDLLAPRGTPVRAVDAGVIRRLATSGRGGITIYQVDPDGLYCYYYAHLERYAPFLREGQVVEKGDVIGAVGTTGNAPPSAPHLHFAIFRLDDPERWWQGRPVNPYRLWASR
jgi:murein DD-endopeptidase MepM/ murein hydrolase activator NlpD